MKQTKKAFTLVELAIVLVIIGILLGAVLKSQSLIGNAKEKRLHSLIQELQAGVLTYYDKYNALPGDDPQAQTHLDNNSTKNGNGNGHIDGGYQWNCADNSKESCAIWEHLRLADILSGNGVTNPHNPYGGSITAIYRTLNGITANWFVLSNIPKKVAQDIDQKYDDGKTDNGDIQYLGNNLYVKFD